MLEHDNTVQHIFSRLAFGNLFDADCMLAVVQISLTYSCGFP